MQPALIRGNTFSVQNATTELLIEIYTVLGNTWTTTAETLLENNVTTSVNATSVMPIIAFNTVYKENGANNGASLLQLNELIGSTIGAAVVQNLFESIAPNSNTALLYLSADESSGTPNNNHITWLNTMIGGPLNYAYNSGTGAASGMIPLLRNQWSTIGNLMEQRAIKSDTYTGYGGAAGAMVGNWGALFGTGQRSNGWTELSVGSPGFPAVGNFCNEFAGIYTSDTAINTSTSPAGCATRATINYWSYNNRQAFNGTTGTSGGGDYRLLSNSPATNFFPSNVVYPGGGSNVLPYDLKGQIRDNSGWGSAGAYEQAIIMTQVFGWLQLRSRP